MTPFARDPLVIIGAGPAGLTAAYELVLHDVHPIVIDQDVRVGGLAQTVEHRGYRFDIGGHRFFTKVAIVHGLWRSMLGADFLERPRLSRIYYHRKLFDYPLKPMNALRGLGAVSAALVLASYLWAKIAPVRPEVSFEDWVTNRFGRKLYRIFFESYTEKVWGIPGREIRAQWAAQRIKGLSLRTALLSMLRRKPTGGKADAVRTLISEFEYPRLGPGMMWEKFRDAIAAGGGSVQLGRRVTGIHHDAARVTALDVDHAGVVTNMPASHVISTMAIRDLILAMRPAPPDDVIEAARRLSYRDFITVALVVRQADVFPDNWIYIHEASVKVGRIQNFKNWSPDMVPDPSTTCLGLEYFCNEGDALWSLGDAELVALAKRELDVLGLVDTARMADGCVVRMRKAYPVYDEGYEGALEVIKKYLAPFANLQLVGRNGMHKYNNQDHSMVTAMLAVRNLFGERHDLWDINSDDEYHEGAASLARSGIMDKLAATQPRAPLRVKH